MVKPKHEGLFFLGGVERQEISKNLKTEISNCVGEHAPSFFDVK